MTEPLRRLERAFFERLALVRSGGDSIRRSMAASSFYAAVETVRAKGNGGSNRTAVKKVLLRAENRRVTDSVPKRRLPMKTVY